jgi:hypothetical protein
MMSRALVTTGIALLGMGCVAELEDAPDPEITNVAIRCPTCDDNGLPPPAWEVAAAELHPSRLAPAGLLIAGRVTPLCEPGTKSTSAGLTTCNLARVWSDWANAAPLYRPVLVTYMVKVGAPHGVEVKDLATGITMPGAFGLAPTVLDLSWDYRTQSLITGGMGSLVDQVANGVHLCLKTEFTPDCPAFAYPFHELAVVGNHFAGQLELVVGGYDAEYPEDSKRVCMGAGVPCNTYASKMNYHAAYCSYIGAWNQRHPSACTVPGRPPFDYAVQVFLEKNPSSFGSTGGTGIRL